MPLRDFFVDRTRVLLSLSTILVFLCAGGRAQEVLTLEQCIVLARENSPRTRLAMNAVRTAELSLAEIGKTALPQMSGTGTAIYAPVPPRLGYDPAISNGGQLAGQVVLRQSIYDAGIRSLRSDQLRLDVERTTGEADLAEHELTYWVRQTYSEALRAQEEVDLRLESYRQLATYSDLVRRLYTGGAAGYADVLKAEMQKSMASLAVEKARESSATARLSLAELTGVPVDSSARFGTPATTPERAPGESNDLGQSLEMHIARLELERSRLEVQVANHELLPVLSLVADAGYLSSGENLRFPDADRLNAWGYSVGVGVEIPILNWGATGLRVEQRELAVDDLRLRMELLRRSISTEVRKTLLELAQAQARLRTLQETIGKAQENFLLTSSRYAGGGTLALEVFASQHFLTETRLDELQTRADIRILNARLERLTAQSQPSKHQ
jgi:outer membrane protein